MPDNVIGTFYVENLGCAKNQVDAEVMIAALRRRGWTYAADDPDAADLIIVNTCGFIRSAQEEAVNALLGARRDYPGKRVIAAGCLAQRWSAELPELIPELDGVFGNRAPQRVGEMLDAVMDGGRPVFTPDGVDRGERRRDFFGFDRSVFVKIADGCNHNCRYCAIPLIKGPLKSRPADEVLAETLDLIDQGVFELNFVAQDLAAYGSDVGEGVGVGLDTLLRRILAARPEGDFRLRMLYLHPDDFPRSLLDLMTSDPRVLPYLDIPFQHAAVPVLRAMGRRGDRRTYLDLVAEIRDRLPDAVIRSTFLVGHPGERRREFDELRRFQEEAALDWLGVFAWSREDGTAAARDQGPLAARLRAPAARRRREILEARQQSITGERLDRWIGRELRVLIEEPVAGEDLALGRSWFQAPEVDGSIVVHGEDLTEGDVVDVRIARRTGVDLQGVPR